MSNQTLVKFIVLLLLTTAIPFYSCNKMEKQPDGLQMSIKMADSEMVHFPISWTVDFRQTKSWSYCEGLIAYSMMRLWKTTNDSKYYEYAKSYADAFISEEGVIETYRKEEYNIDRINSGKFLFDLYKETGDNKYKLAIENLRDQLRSHPRTSEGGFWHKKIYTHQMWLDGLYMGAPFYAQYAKVFNEPEAFDDIVNQFRIIHKYTYDPATGLNYHGWDESKEQRWADTETGCSPNFWGRGLGWYAMALLDVMDFLPEDHKGRPELVAIFKQVVEGFIQYQDEETGVWYQVLNMPDKEGNYLESSVSAMFTYSLLKGVNKGFIDRSYKAYAEKAYQGILDQFIVENENGTISLTDVCAGAGLGGNPYRDGSFEYYINEKIRDNDAKGVGPFILAGIELAE